jgi:hypothetical protein
MKMKDIKNEYESWADAMRKLGLGVNTYMYWKKIGYIPIPMQRRIEKASNGFFKSDL